MHGVVNSVSSSLIVFGNVLPDIGKISTCLLRKFVSEQLFEYRAPVALLCRQFRTCLFAHAIKIVL